MRPLDFHSGADGTTRPRSHAGLTRRSLILGAASLTTLVGPVTAAYAGIEAAQALQVRRYRLTPPTWRAGHRLSITVIADLHAGGPNMGLARIRNIVDVANLQRSDLVVLLGDYFATHRFITEVVSTEAWAGELARLRAPLGVYAILGNHDWWHNVGGTRRAFADVKIPVLENDALLLGKPGAKFWLAGLGDQLAHKIGPHNFRGVDDLPGTLKRVATDDPVILLAHEPDVFPKVPDRVALTLCGHTHGGQIRIPFLWEHFVPSIYGARYAYGHVIEDGRHLIVSGGLGTSSIPARLGVQPEILRIEIG
ncbi:MAG: metallophosphoesterase [Pseudorhodoplanes sp.]|jgi:predicted MPP superfamily phosphohydrolase|nr:metallophosphoesterase [Pseudorhodoplanes sp.]